MREHVADRSQTETDEVRGYYAHNQRVWGKLARFYDAMSLPAKGLRRRVARLAGVGPGSRILDVATGTGAQALAFAAQGARVVGVDLSDEMLAIARKKNRFQRLVFERADAVALPFADRRFDVSSISFALHEMPVAVREAVVRELARVTRRGGTIVVVDYALPRNQVMRWTTYHLIELFEGDLYSDFVRRDLPALLAGANLDVVETHSALLGAARITIATLR